MYSDLNLGPYLHIVTVANTVSCYARFAQCTATYPTYSPHCNCSCRVSTPREDHKKPCRPTIFVVLSTAEQHTSPTSFFFQLSISGFLVHIVHLTSFRPTILSFFLHLYDVSITSICNTQHWVSMSWDYNSFHLSYTIYLPLPRYDLLFM